MGSVVGRFRVAAGEGLGVVAGGGGPWDGDNSGDWGEGVEEEEQGEERGLREGDSHRCCWCRVLIVSKRWRRNGDGDPFLDAGFMEGLGLGLDRGVVVERIRIGIRILCFGGARQRFCWLIVVMDGGN